MQEGQPRESFQDPPSPAESRHRADGAQARQRPPSQGFAPLARRAAGPTSRSTCAASQNQQKGADRGKAKQWVDRQRHERELQESRRLLYVACTRARDELHLFARPSYKSAEDGSLILVEPSESLLKTAWPAFEADVRRRFDEWRESNISVVSAAPSAASAQIESIAASGEDSLFEMPSPAKPTPSAASRPASVPPPRGYRWPRRKYRTSALVNCMNVMKAGCFRAHSEKRFTFCFNTWQNRSLPRRGMQPVRLSRLSNRVSPPRFAPSASIRLMPAASPHTRCRLCSKLPQILWQIGFSRRTRKQPAKSAGRASLTGICALCRSIAYFSMAAHHDRPQISLPTQPGGSSITKLHTRTASIPRLHCRSCAGPSRRRSNPTHEFCATCMARMRPSSAACTTRGCCSSTGGNCRFAPHLPCTALRRCASSLAQFFGQHVPVVHHQFLRVQQNQRIGGKCRRSEGAKNHCG